MEKIYGDLQLKKPLIVTILLIAGSVLADDLSQSYEKAYFLETAKGQKEEALEIYRKIAAEKPTEDNKETIRRALERMQVLYGNHKPSPLQGLVDNFDMSKGTLNKIVRIFGEPDGYYLGKEKLKKNSLPDYFCMKYKDGFQVWMEHGMIKEFRFEDEPLYTIAGITTGTSLERVLSILGRPRKIIENRECGYEERILYKNNKGRPRGHAYYADKGLRMFFMGDKVCALYVTDNTILRDK